MKIEKIILNFVKSEKKDLEIAGLRGLVRTGENEWSFRFTFREGDFLTFSDLYKVKLEGLNKIPIFVTKEKSRKTNSSKIKQK